MMLLDDYEKAFDSICHNGMIYKPIKSKIPQSTELLTQSASLLLRAMENKISILSTINEDAFHRSTAVYVLFECQLPVKSNIQIA